MHTILYIIMIYCEYIIRARSFNLAAHHGCAWLVVIVGRGVLRTTMHSTRVAIVCIYCTISYSIHIVVIVYTVKVKYYDLRYGGGDGKGAGKESGVGRVGERVYGSIDSIGWKYCTIGRYRSVVGGRWSGVGGRGGSGLGVGCW